MYVSWGETISDCASVSKRVVLQWTFHIYENEFDLDDNEAVRETYFHMNRVSCDDRVGLVLTQMQKTTQK